MSRHVTFAPLEGFTLSHVRGPAARSTIESAVVDAPTKVLTARTLPGGGFVACLGKKEYFLMTPFVTLLLAPTRQDELTVTPRSDAIFQISGKEAGVWLQQTSPVNLADRPGDDFLMSRLLQISCWLTRAGVNGTSHRGFLIGCDPTYRDYFAEALTQSLQNFEAALKAV